MRTILSLLGMTIFVDSYCIDWTQFSWRGNLNRATASEADLSLTPVLLLKELRLDGSSIGLVFASMGVRSVLSAIFVIPRLRSVFTTDALNDNLSRHFCVCLSFN